MCCGFVSRRILRSTSRRSCLLPAPWRLDLRLMKDSFIDGDEGRANLATRLRALGIGRRRSRTEELSHFGAHCQRRCSPTCSTSPQHRRPSGQSRWWRRVPIRPPRVREAGADEESPVPKAGRAGAFRNSGARRWAESRRASRDLLGRSGRTNRWFRESDLMRPFVVPGPNVVAVQDQRVGLIRSAVRAPQPDAVWPEPQPRGRR